MEDITLKQLWKAQDEKLEKTMKLNLYLLESLQKQKAESKLNSLARFKGWAVALGIVWVLFLGLLLYGNQLQNIYFTVSVGMILLFNIVAIIIYARHIVLIRELDYSATITGTQQKLSRLQSSTLNLRFLFLQTPSSPWPSPWRRRPQPMQTCSSTAASSNLRPSARASGESIAPYLAGRPSELTQWKPGTARRTASTGYDGNNVMEMDAYGNVMVDQIVGTSGGSYTLSFLYAQRSGVSPTSGSFEVWWNGGLVVSLAPTSTVMALYSTTVIGNAVNTSELRGTGTQDQLGALIDVVQLAAVPGPSTFVAGALLALPFGLQGIRYLRSRRTIS